MWKGVYNFKNITTDKKKNQFLRELMKLSLWQASVPTCRSAPITDILGHFFTDISGLTALDKVPCKPKATEKFKQ